MKKKRVKKSNNKVIEFGKGKTRQEEERFFITFSGTQLNAILLIILSATFLVQGIIRYLEIIERIDLLRPWFRLVFLAIVFLVISVITITLGGIISPLKLKRQINLISFVTFLLGFLLFLVSLFFLILAI